MSSQLNNLVLSHEPEEACHSGQFAQKLSRLRYMSEMLAELHAMSLSTGDKTLTYFIGMAAMEANEKIEVFKFQDVFREDEI